MHAKIKVSWKFTGVKSNLTMLHSQSKKEKPPLGSLKSRISKWQGTKSQVGRGWTEGLNRVEIHTHTNSQHSTQISQNTSVTTSIHRPTREWQIIYYIYCISSNNWLTEIVNLQRKHFSLKNWVTWSSPNGLIHQKLRILPPHSSSMSCNIWDACIISKLNQAILSCHNLFGAISHSLFDLSAQPLHPNKSKPKHKQKQFVTNISDE